MSFMSTNAFDELSIKFSHLLYERTEDDHDLINQTLDELNNLNYRYLIVRNFTKAVLLINNCCTVVPPDDKVLVPKCCKLIANLLNTQKLSIEGRTLKVCTEWILQTLKQNPESLTEALIALDSLLNNHKENLQMLIPLVLSENGSLSSLATKENPSDVVLYTVKCLESCTELFNFKTNLNAIQLLLCRDVFNSYLLSEKGSNFEDIHYCKVLVSCINGLRNIVLCDQEYLKKELGLLLGIAKCYMTYGIKGLQFSKPIKLMPTNLSIPEPVGNLPEKRGGKVARQRKQRISNIKNKNLNGTGETYADEQFCSHYSSIMEPSSDNEMLIGSNTKYKTSDSDFSDSETKITKLGAVLATVRQTALNFFFKLIKLTDRKTVFSYWSNFIPDGTPSIGSHSLTTCILKDPSPSGRMAALNVLLTLLTRSKLYLAQAEYSEKTTAFTPFSVTLGYIIKELHRCLSLALNENSSLVLIQVLKCFAGLVQATPYHRLSKGMITKVVRNVKLYVNHRDARVQVAALIVIGCIFTVEPVIPEARSIFIKRTFPKSISKNASLNASTSLDDLEYVNFSSDDEEISESENTTEMPWILEKCLENLGKDLSEEQENTVLTPVKAESLQILCAMSRNYITSLMAPYLSDIAKVLKRSLFDNNIETYAERTIDFIGQAMNSYLTNNTDSIKAITTEQALFFWQHLIDDILARLVQNDKESLLRAIGCDCLGSIGADVFEHLPKNKQILIITILFACSRDDEYSVIGAAIRALGICLDYPSMREDSGFIVDVAESILRTYDSPNLIVRVKTSWSLGNLSRAMVLNKTNADCEDIPFSLLSKLLNISISLCFDNDRVKFNAVRSIGNLLQLITEDHISQEQFIILIDKSIKTLITKCFEGSYMKVKWNSCYAFGNILKNDVIFQVNSEWQESIFHTLMELVQNHKNFKVRINAALALSSPKTRKSYGNFYHLTWTSLMKALENSQNMDDLKEYKHRDNLVEQICLTLGYLVKFLTLKDLNLLQNIVILHGDLLKIHMHRVLERLLPEKSNNIFLATEHISNLKPDTEAQRSVISLLFSVFQNT